MNIALIIPPMKYEHPVLYLKERYDQILNRLGFAITRTSKFNKKKYPPLSLICLAEYLKRKTPFLKTSILDGEIISLKKIIEHLILIRPAYVGISPTWASYESTLKIARASKKIGAKVVLGGVYAAPLAKEILLNRGPGSKDYCVDAVCREDGEQCFSDFVLGRPMDKIPNLVYRNGPEIKYNRPKFLNLNSLPWQNLSYINIEDYRYDGYRGFGAKELCVFSRKGCAKRTKRGACYFCSLAGGVVRYKSPAKFFQEMDFIIKKYSPQIIFDISDDFTDNPAWLSEFHRLYRKYSAKPALKIFALFEKLDISTVKKLAEINVRQIILGVESGDDLILSGTSKKYSAIKIKSVIKMLISAGIKIDISLILGLKGETVSSLKNTVKLVKFLSKFPQVEIYPQHMKLIPGTQAFHWLNQATNQSYCHQDSYCLYDAVEDWLSFFTKITPRQILAALKEIIYHGNCPGYWFVKFDSQKCQAPKSAILNV